MVSAPALLTVAEVAITLRCSRSRVFELLVDGTLVRGPRFGKKTVVLAESVFAALEAEYHPAPPVQPKRVRRGGRGLISALASLRAERRASRAG